MPIVSSVVEQASPMSTVFFKMLFPSQLGLIRFRGRDDFKRAVL